MAQKSSTPGDATGLPRRSVRGALRLSTLDGALASVFGALTGGVFLTGFALRLGANDLLIGLLASLPLLAAVAQLAGAYLIERVGGRRRAVCIGGAGSSRILWLAALALPLLAAADSSWVRGSAPWGLLAVAALSQVLGSLGGVAWLSWMADLVPIGVRGRYFGSRNVVCGVATALATIAAGWYLDRFAPGGPPWDFATLFLLAVVAGWGSVAYLRKVPERPALPEPRSEPFLDLARRPFADPNFRRFVRFSILFNGAVHFAAPFFTVYMLEALRLSYTQVATLATLSTVAHLVTIRGWGRLADRYGNRPVIVVTAALAAPVPLVWLLVDGDNAAWLTPTVHLLGGSAWAGYGLATSNLLLKLTPRTHNAVYFSMFGALTGIGSAAGPVIGGLVGLWLHGSTLDLGPVVLDSFGVIFACSFAGRVTTVLLLRGVSEPRQASVREVIRMLSTVRGFNTLMGVDEVLQFVVVALRDRIGLRPARLFPLPGGRAGAYTEGPLRRPRPPGAPAGEKIGTEGRSDVEGQPEEVPRGG